MKESDLTKAVLDLAATLGYLCYHPRTSQVGKGWATAAQGNGAKGFPDCVLVGNSRVIFAELKCGRNGLSDEQVEWRTQILLNHGEWFLFTEKDWLSGAIEAELKGERCTF